MSKGYWGTMIIGILWFSLGVLLLAVFVLSSVTAEPPPRPQTIPSSITDMEVWDSYYGTYWNKFPLFAPCGEELAVKVDSFQTTQGKWSGQNAMFVMTSPNYTTISAVTHTDSWYMLLDEDKTAEPMVLLSFDQEYLHQWVTGQVKMDIYYPVTVGSGIGGLETESKHIERDINVFVVTPEEASVTDEHNEWESRFKLDVLVVSVVFFILPGGLLLRYAHRNRKYG